MTIEVRQMVIRSEVEDGAARAVAPKTDDARAEASQAVTDASNRLSLATMRAIVDRLERMRER